MGHASHAKKSKTATRLPPEEDPEFQIAPMIDILLVLLVFFMSISTSEILQVAEGVHLPIALDAKPRDTGAKKGGEIIVNVLWESISDRGSLEVTDKKFDNVAAIAPILADAVRKSPQTRVLIRADKKVRYEYLRQVIRVAGESGVGKVTFSVVDKEEQ